MAKILYFTEVSGAGEYIVITDAPAREFKGYTRPGYMLADVVNIGMVPNSLPLDRELSP